MDAQWQEAFRARMRRFEIRRQPKPNELSLSIKIRVRSGCFHREHSPHAYALIDQQLGKLLPSETGLVFEEHETGPEVLVYVAVATAGLTLAKSVIDLVTAIIKTRSAGVEKGDRPSEPLELVVLSFAIIPSACKRLTWKRMKTNNRETCQAPFCASFDSFDS
jgi:hypothetical protein